MDFDPRFYWAAVEIAGPKATECEVGAVAQKLDRLNRRGSPLPRLCVQAAKSKEGIPPRFIQAFSQAP